MPDTIEVRGVAVPSFMYGTAWKEADTARCVRDALAVGFRAIDTANQRKHYHEVGVGEALAAAFAGGLTRAELFVQTKFTYRRGQDHRLPYDPQASLPTQVEQSFASSLAHLGCDHIDSYVLHGPASGARLTDDDWQVWRAMEQLVAAGKVRLLGISNIEVHHLRALCAGATVQPAFVQNRCYAHTGWDRELRSICRDLGVVYQGFSLLTANARALAQPRFVSICAALGRTPAQVVFRFAQQLGMLPLTGTTNPEHMREDLLGLAFELDRGQLQTIEQLVC
jgi:diketogulonate reductase-like aldo/keto reductase